MIEAKFRNKFELITLKTRSPPGRASDLRGERQKNSKECWIVTNGIFPNLL